MHLHLATRDLETFSNPLLDSIIASSLRSCDHGSRGNSRCGKVLHSPGCGYPEVFTIRRSKCLVSVARVVRFIQTTIVPSLFGTLGDQLRRHPLDPSLSVVRAGQAE